MPMLALPDSPSRLLDPLAVNEDRDPQLDAAISQVIEELKTAKPMPRKSAPPVPMQLGN